MARVLPLIVIALAAVIGACSTAPAPGRAAAAGSPAGTAGGASPAARGPFIAAKDLKFDRSDLKVPANAPFALVFDNQEAPPHNVAINDASGKSVFTGEVFSGPAQRTYQVPALQPGSYTFICQVHPDMQGTLTAQ